MLVWLETKTTHVLVQTVAPVQLCAISQDVFIATIKAYCCQQASCVLSADMYIIVFMYFWFVSQLYAQAFIWHLIAHESTVLTVQNTEQAKSLILI